MGNKNGNQYYRLPILNGLEFFSAKNHKVNFPFHSHPTFNITLILDKTFATKLSDQFLQAPNGSLFLTNPDEVHATICESQLGNSFCTFYVSPEVLKTLNHDQPVFFNDRTIYDQSLFLDFYRLAQHIDSPDFPIEEQLLPLLQRLMNHAATEIAFNDKRTLLFRQFIEETNLEKFSLEQTARQFGLDKFKFLRLFKQETGLTPNNFIILQRIEKSKLLLQASSDLLDIALQTGFYDATHFCKHFKRITGISPGVFRNA